MISQSQIRALANMGFVVVTPEYRLCPQVSLYEGPIQDAKDCLVWVQEKLPALLEEDGAEAEDGNEGKRMRVDGGRVVVAGYSCGGNLALHLVSATLLPFYFTCACRSCIRSIRDYEKPRMQERDRQIDEQGMKAERLAGYSTQPSKGNPSLLPNHLLCLTTLPYPIPPFRQHPYTFFGFPRGCSHRSASPNLRTDVLAGW